MTECDKCGREIADDEICFHKEVIEGTGKEPCTGHVEVDEDLCEDCYFRFK